jgi:replicative DNA helicase
MSRADLLEQKRKIERALIGGLLEDPTRINGQSRRLELVNRNSEQLHRRIVDAMLQLVDQNGVLDIRSIVEVAQLSSQDTAELQVMLDQDRGTVERRGLQLVENAIKLELLDHSEKQAAPDAIEAAEEIEHLHQRVQELLALGIRRESKADVAEAYHAATLRAAAGAVQYFPTGLETLDTLLGGGLTPGNLSILAGYPAVGKSSLLLAFALSFTRANHPTLFVEYEMPRDEVFSRLAGITTGGNVHDLRNGRSDALNQEFLAEFLRIPLTIHFPEQRGLPGLLRDAREFAQEGGKVLIVDYLQGSRWTAARSEDEWTAIKSASEQLRTLARNTGLHVLAASSLNRSEARQGNGRISLASLYGSSGLGHDASVVLALKNDEEADSENTQLHELETRRRKVRLDILKSRESARGNLSLIYHLDSQRFFEVAPRHELRAAG